jgi:hypothetical protein
MVVLEATAPCIIRGYGQYNRGERAVFSDEEAVRLLDEFPDGWRECHHEDAKIKALTAPQQNKMQKAPERKK